MKRIPDNLPQIILPQNKGTAVEISGKKYWKSMKEMKVINDALRYGISKAARMNSIARPTLYRYMALSHVAKYFQERIARIVALQDTDLGYLTQKARDAADGKIELSRQQVDCLRFLARVLGYDKQKVEHEFSYDLSFTTENLEAPIDTTSSAIEGDRE